MSNAVVQFDPVQAQSNVMTLPGDAPLHDKIVAVLRTIYDPELPVNIYDLGLIYTIELRERHVDVVMTLTSPNCPVAGSMPGQVECAIKALDEVDDVCVELTWDPPWDSDKLSDEVKLTLGLL